VRAIVLTLSLLIVLSASVRAETTLTNGEVRRLALEHNRTLLSAARDVDKADAEIKRAWADALPNVSLSAGYNRNFTLAKSYFTMSDPSTGQSSTTELQFGFKNSYNARVSLAQPISQGGKVLTALQVARLYKDYTQAISAQVEAEVFLAADQLFYVAILARSQLDVLRSALASNSENLEVTRKLHSQGMASDYEVLRAQVERDNLLPQVAAAESHVRLSEKRLKSFLGLELNEPIVLEADSTNTLMPATAPLPSLIDTALVLRPESVQATSLRQIAERGIKIAKADRWPSLDAVAAYDWTAGSDDFTLRDNSSSSWTAGLVLNFSIFDGGRTGGNIKERQAQHAQAVLQQAQMKDDITLEVEASWDALEQAWKALEVQKMTIASAEEGLRIARLRFETGVGTQLEVLSAQTALTEAQRLQAEALYNFRLAKASLEKATTLSMNTKR
jgi:outer membrane protein TolC